MTHQDKLKAIIDHAIKNGWEIGELVWEDLMDEFEGYDLNTTLEMGYSTVLWFIFGRPFLQAFFGNHTMYLIDTSPDWAHDMGDVERAWVTDEQLKDYCAAELKAFRKEHEDILDDKDKKASFEILTYSIISKWEDPFKFAFMELSAWEHYGQELVLADNHLDYLYSFIEQAK